METIENNSPETEALLQRMKEVRRDLDEGVQEIVEGARGMGDWRSYVTSYPWICLGAALAAGYLIVPRRRLQTRSVPRTPEELALQSQSPAKSPGPLSSSLGGRLLAFAGELAMRELSSFVAQQTSQFIASQTARLQQEDRP